MRWVLAILFVWGATVDTSTAPARAAVFDRDNLVAWCIVPFDAGHRTPAQRADMLDRLRFRKYAYDGERNIYRASPSSWMS
jgi:hypothetical protein